MNIKHKFRKLFWQIGYDISRFSPVSSPLARIKKLIESYKIDIVLDVGANTGQFAEEMRYDVGFSGKLVSFEPLSSAFELLNKNAAKDPQWEVMRYALGDVEGKVKINIAGNSASSSILNMLSSHSKSDPESKYIGTEIIEIKTLDAIFSEICSEDDNIYLKIDTQGYESKVIEGAENSLAHIDTIQLEMSLVPLYQDELLFNEMYSFLLGKNYNLVSIKPGFLDENSGQLLQIEGIFHRF